MRDHEEQEVARAMRTEDERRRLEGASSPYYGARSRHLLTIHDLDLHDWFWCFPYVITSLMPSYPTPTRPHMAARDVGLLLSGVDTRSRVHSIPYERCILP
jgi:hypothetical protein